MEKNRGFNNYDYSELICKIIVLCDKERFLKKEAVLIYYLINEEINTIVSPDHFLQISTRPPSPNATIKDLVEDFWERSHLCLYALEEYAEHYKIKINKERFENIEEYLNSFYTLINLLKEE